MRIEHEYQRCGAWAYIAALDVHHARIFGCCEATTGIAPFHRLVEQVMTRPPYDQARRVFWIVDNGSSHRGATAIDEFGAAGVLGGAGGSGVSDSGRGFVSF